MKLKTTPNRSITIKKTNQYRQKYFSFKIDYGTRILNGVYDSATYVTWEENISVSGGSRYLSLTQILVGANLLNKISPSWNYYKITGVAMSFVPLPINMNPSVAQVNAVAVCFAPGVSGNLSYQDIIDRTGSRILNPFQTTRFYMSTNLNDEWYRLASVAEVANASFCIAHASSGSSGATPQFAVKITFYIKVKGRKI